MHNRFNLLTYVTLHENISLCSVASSEPMLHPWDSDGQSFEPRKTAKGMKHTMQTLMIPLCFNKEYTIYIHNILQLNRQQKDKNITNGMVLNNRLLTKHNIAIINHDCNTSMK